MKNDISSARTNFAPGSMSSHDLTRCRTTALQLQRLIKYLLIFLLLDQNYRIMPSTTGTILYSPSL